MDQANAACDADGVIITGELARRPSRTPDYEAEARALALLGEVMSVSPGSVLQQLVETAIALTRSDSAGISLLESGGDQGVFRWATTAGAWAPYRNGTMPRAESPCGEVIGRDTVLLVNRPARAWPALMQADPAIAEGLLVPFHIDGVAVGTVWTIKHDPAGRFDAEDVRLITSLARFASAAHQMVLALERVEEGRQADRARAETTMRETENKYRTLFEMMGQGYALVELVRDASGKAIDQRYIEFNPAVERLLGISAADAAGRLASDVFPGIEPWWTENFDRTVRENAPTRIEHFFAPLQRWFEVYAYPAGGDRFVTLYEDITERRQADQALRKSEERQTFLLVLGDPMRTETSANAVIAIGTKLLGEELNASRVVIAEIDDAAGLAHIREGWTAEGAERHPPTLRLADFGGPLLTDLRAGRNVRFDDVGAPPYARGDLAALAAINVRAGLSVPLIVGGRFVLNINVHQHEPRHWTDGEVALVEDVGTRIWAAVGRARAETALADSEERFRTLAESIEDVFYMTDLDRGALTYLSPSYERMWGRPAAELEANLASFTESIHPADRARVSQGKAAQEHGEAIAVEYRIIRPDGAVRWIYDRSFPAPGLPGRRAAGIASDITERKSVEAARHQYEERLRLVVDSTRDYAIFTLDMEGRVVDWYAGAETVFGFSAQEIQGRDFAVLYTPEDRAAGAPERELREAKESGSAPNVRWHVHKDGGRVFVEGHVMPLQDAAGTVFGFLKIGQDLTERRRADERMRESERRFRTLAEGIPQLVWRAVDHGEWSWASPQWTAFTGQDDEASHGWGWLDPLHPDDRQDARDAWERSKKTGVFHAEYRVCDIRNGEYRHFQTQASPVVDEHGKLVEWLGTSTDVQSLHDLQLRLGVLVAELQHRTRNLIAVVSALADRTLRKAGTLDEFGTRFRQRLAALSRVQGLLSHLAVGERVTFKELLCSELAAHGATNGSSHRVTLDGPDDVPLRSGTVQIFALALHELATNAVKYGALSGGAGHLFVRWRLEPAPSSSISSYLHVEWRETGVTMPPVGAPARGGGYGRELIERALPYQLKAKTTYEMAADGVRCMIIVPVVMEE